MNRLFLSAALLTAGLPLGVSARSISFSNGPVSYVYSAAQAGEMTFEGETVKVGDRLFELGEWSRMQVGDEAPEENTVTVVYDGGAATVTVAGNIAPYVEAEVEGAHVSITQSAEVSETTCGEITYVLSGAASDGSLTLTGSYKSTLELRGLDLTNPTGAAIDIQNGKRIELSAKNGTVNTLTDGAGDQKAALYCKGHLELKGKGTLKVNGTQTHGIRAKEYITVKNLTLEVSVAKDAAKCVTTDEYLTVESGTLTLSSSADGIWDSEKLKTKASACLGADGDILIQGGTLTLRATGSGGKGISCDGVFTCDGGTIDIATTGGMLVYSNGQLNHNYTSSADRIASDNKSSSKGIKADSGVVINDGDLHITTATNNAEGIESKTTMEINGGRIFVKAYDDGINSSNDFTVNGGELTVISIVGDGLDSNGNLTVAGGYVRTMGSGGMEMGLDAATESGCAVYLTGGTLMAFGGNNTYPTKSGSTQAYVKVSGSVKAGDEILLKEGETVLATFTVPEEYNASASTPSTPWSNAMRGPGNGPGGGGWQPGGASGGGSLMLSAPELVSGKSYTVVNGTATSTATAALTGR